MDDDAMDRLARDQGLDRARHLFPEEMARAVALATEQRAALSRWPLAETDEP